MKHCYTLKKYIFPCYLTTTLYLQGIDIPLETETVRQADRKR